MIWISFQGITLPPNPSIVLGVEVLSNISLQRNFLQQPLCFMIFCTTWPLALSRCLSLLHCKLLIHLLVSSIAGGFLLSSIISWIPSCVEFLFALLFGVDIVIAVGGFVLSSLNYSSLQRYRHLWSHPYYRSIKGVDHKI